MILRLRSRDGLERLEVLESMTLAGLKLAIHQQMNIPVEEILISKNPDLLTSPNPYMFNDLTDHQQSLQAAGLCHGDVLYLKYAVQREVTPVHQRSIFEARRFGVHMTLDDVIAKQTKIERQEAPHVDSLSFDMHAANTFQSYVQAALAFSIKRGGILYGTVDEQGQVKVEFVYEPPQEGTADYLQLHRNTDEEKQVDFLAELLGYKKVGWIFSQSINERDFIVSVAEVKQMAEYQDEMGEKSVTVLVSFDPNEEGGHVHFEAFQVSDLCVRLWKAGWIQDEAEPSGVAKMKNPQEPDVKDPVIVAGKDVDHVDNDFFLVPVKILDHEGPLLTHFPVENRLIPQGRHDLKEQLTRVTSPDFTHKISDLHLLLWLSKQHSLEVTDIMLLCEAVREHQPVMEGHCRMLESIADL